jgi:hypothetical protein
VKENLPITPIAPRCCEAARRLQRGGNFPLPTQPPQMKNEKCKMQSENYPALPSFFESRNSNIESLFSSSRSSLKDHHHMYILAILQTFVNEKTAKHKGISGG